MLFVVLNLLLEAFKWMLIARALASWFISPHSRHPLMRMLQQVTEPVLAPIRERMPATGGVDLSPIVAFLLVQVLQILLLRVF